MAFQTDADGNIYDDGQPSPVQITVTPQSKLPVDYGNSGNTPSWVNLDNSQFDQTAFDAAAERLKRGADHRLKLPVSDDRYNLLPSENPTYMMQPDLQNTQAGDVPLPPGAALNDAGQPYWTATGQPVPVVDRPGILPFARTPEGIKLAMPKMLDLASNIVGGGVAAKVPIKAGEMVLGSGVVRKTPEVLIAPKAGPQIEANTQVLKNPTSNDFKDFMKESGGRVRTFIDKDDNLYAWNAHNATHEGVAGSLGLNIKNWGNEWFTSNGKMYPAGDVKEGYPSWLKEGRLLSDTKGTVAGQAAHQIEKNGFYSQLERSVKDARLEKGNAEQWLGYLKNQPGVKSEEINTVLKDLPAGQITKNEMENIVKQNKVELKEKVLQNKNSNDFDMGTIRDNDIREHFNIPWNKWENLKSDQINNYRRKYIDENYGGSPTKYHSYQLPGGENYKEMLLSLPDTRNNQAAKDLIFEKMSKFHNISNGVITPEFKKLQAKFDALNHPPFKSPHWNKSNVLAHIRMNDRNVEGSKTLHLEEIQSDLHQKGRDLGYKGEKEKLQPAFDKIEEKLMATNDEKMLGQPRIADVLNEAVGKKIITPEEAKTYKRYTDIENSKNPVPDLPFKNNWEELAIKRIIRHAAENGYEGISWEHGNAQALRYPDELRKAVNSIEWYNKTNGKVGDIKHILVDTKNGPETTFDIDKNGTILSGPKEAKGKHLSEVIGKQMAGDILGKAEGNINAKDFVMGAEGMKSAYDVRIPNKFNEIGKKYGSKVEQREIPTDSTSHRSLAHFLDWAEKNYGDKYSRSQLGDFWKHGEQIPIVKEFMNSKINKPIHYFPITPALKAKALQEGFPLFSSSPILTAVNGNPFDQQQKQNFKLTPVAFNPFVQ